MANSNSNSANTGVVPVESAPLYPGASSPAQSAVMYRQEQTAKQSAMNKSGGKKRRNYRGGAQTVPTFNTPGPQVSSGSQNPNASSMSVNSSLTQGSANSVCDKCIGEASNSAVCQGPQCNPQAGGRQKGGNCGANGLIVNGQPWGCLSGGKKSKKSKK
jgi:hypothetical protein